MSIDLFVVRERPLTWAEALGAGDAIAKTNDGFSLWSLEPETADTTAYFWKVGRVSMSWTSPDPDDAQEDDPPELAQPFVVVSSRSGAWPWIEWTALALAERLTARVFDPQQGDFYDAGATAEHDFAALRALHDVWLREAKPVLITNHWAFGVGDPGVDGVRAHVKAIEAAARDVLGIDQTFSLSDDQISFSHRFDLAGAQISVSTDGGSLYDPNRRRSLNVAGPVDDARLRAFADALARSLGARFRAVEEYAPRSP
jgi:hypothetical protein